MIEIIGEFRTRLLLAVNDTRVQDGLVFQIITQIADQLGIFRKTFSDNVARAVERRLHIWHFRRDVGCGKLGRHKAAIGEDRFGKSGASPRSRAISARVRRFGL